MLWDWLGDIVDGIKSLPALIMDGIKGLFIPDSDKVQNSLDRLSGAFRSATGVSVVDFGSVFGSEKSTIPSVEGSVDLYGIGTITGIFADFSFIDSGVKEFRPYIRGFFVFGLAFYNLNQFLGFIGAGGISTSKEARKELE